MITRHIWYLRKALRKIWVRVVAFAVLSIGSAGFAQLLSPFVPESLVIQSGANAVGEILRLVASSMLAVTIFSLSIAVTAFGTAGNSATPRATALLQEDGTTQNVLATFLGAFLFSLLGLILLNAQLYDTSGRVVLFIVTIAVVALVIFALIRWIGHLMSFGRMANTLDRVEKAVIAALKSRLDNPYLGGRPLTSPPPEASFEVASRESGYVVYIDMQALQCCAEEMGVEVYVDRLPGAFVAPGSALMTVGGARPNEEQTALLCGAFSIARERVFDGDPRFGLIVLTEIASRALSPGVNDPGTAISVLGRLVRVLAAWRERVDPELAFPRVLVAPVTPAEAVVDAFRPIARDGASLIEVQIRLQKSLLALRDAVPEAFAGPAADLSRYAIERARAAGLPEEEMAELCALAQRLEGPDRPARTKSV